MPSKQEQAVDMRIAGASYRQIASQIGVSVGTAFTYTQKALQGTKQDAAEELRAAELLRLDRLMMAVWPRATGGDMDAIDRAIKIMDRRSRLLGLDIVEQAQPVVVNSPLDELRARRAKRVGA